MAPITPAIAGLSLGFLLFEPEEYGLLGDEELKAGQKIEYDSQVLHQSATEAMEMRDMDVTKSERGRSVWLGECENKG